VIPPVNTQALSLVGVPMRLVHAGALESLTDSALRVINESARTTMEADQARRAALRGDLSTLADMLARTCADLKAAEQRSHVQAGELRQQFAAAAAEAVAADRTKLHGCVVSALKQIGYDENDLSDADTDELAEILGDALQTYRAGALVDRLEEATSKIEAAVTAQEQAAPTTRHAVGVDRTVYEALHQTASALDQINRRILAGIQLPTDMGTSAIELARLVEQHVTALRSNAQRDAHRISELQNWLAPNGVLGYGHSVREAELERQLNEARAEINLLRNGVTQASVTTGYRAAAIRDGVPLSSKELVERLVAFIGGLTQNIKAQQERIAEGSVAQDVADRMVQAERDRGNLIMAVKRAIEELTGRTLNNGGLYLVDPVDVAALTKSLHEETGRIAQQRRDDEQAGIDPAEQAGRKKQRRATADSMAALLALATTYYPAKVRDPGTPTNLADFQVAVYLPVPGGKRKTTCARFTLPHRYLLWFDHLEQENQAPAPQDDAHERILDELGRRIIEHPAGGSEQAGIRALRKAVYTVLDGTPDGELVGPDSSNKDLAKALRAHHRMLRLQEVDADAFAEARKTAANLEAALHQARVERDDAYTDRAHVLALLSAHYMTSAQMDRSDPAAPDWPVLTFDLEFEAKETFGRVTFDKAKEGTQVSWHIAARDLPLFAHIPWNEQRSLGRPVERRWDGHTREEKNRRLIMETKRVARLRPAFARLPQVEAELTNVRNELTEVRIERTNLNAKLRELHGNFEAVLGVLSAHYPAQLELPGGKWNDGTLWVTLPANPRSSSRGFEANTVHFPVKAGAAERFPHVARTDKVGLGHCTASERRARLWDEAKRLIDTDQLAKAAADAQLEDAETPC
jgi:hypothetical protein